MKASNLSKLRWHFFHIRRRRPLYVYLLVEGQQNPRKKIREFDYRLDYMGHIDHKVILSRKDFNRNEKYMTKELKKNSKFLLNLLNDSYKVYDKVLKKWDQIYKIDNFHKYSNKRLANLFHQYIESVLEYDFYLMQPLFVEKYMTQYIEKKLKEKGVEHYKDVIFNPVKKGEILREEENLLKVAIKKEQNKPIKKDLQKHVLNFSWMSNSLYNEKYHSEEYYVKRLKKNPKEHLTKLIKEQKEKELSYKKVLKELQGDKDLINIIKTAQESIFFRSFRTERFYQSALYVSNFLKEIAKRLSIKDLTYLIPDEIITNLNKSSKFDKRIISERKKGFCLITNVSNFQCVSGKKLAVLRKQIVLDKDLKKDVKGVVIYKDESIIKGKVFIAKKYQDLKNMKKDSILVTTSTTPDYVPYLNKVKCIITDEGGILCHAAVISRETKIPCVIGTKMATKVLKDGDLVEVDANKGVVRKIK